MLDNPTWSGVIADPVVQAGTLAVVGAIVTRIALRPFPSWKLAGQVFFFAALTVLLLYHDIVPYESVPTPCFDFRTRLHRPCQGGLVDQCRLGR